MWLNAYGVSTHHVYFGTKKNDCFRSNIKVTRASSEDHQDGNVYSLMENLQSGTIYYWRVDAEIDNKISYRGDVWSFQTK